MLPQQFQQQGSERYSAIYWQRKTACLAEDATAAACTHRHGGCCIPAVAPSVGPSHHAIESANSSLNVTRHICGDTDRAELKQDWFLSNLMTNYKHSQSCCVS